MDTVKIQLHNCGNVSKEVMELYADIFTKLTQQCDLWSSKPLHKHASKKVKELTALFKQTHNPHAVYVAIGIYYTLKLAELCYKQSNQKSTRVKHILEMIRIHLEEIDLFEAVTVPTSHIGGHGHIAAGMLSDFVALLQMQDLRYHNGIREDDFQKRLARLLADEVMSDREYRVVVKRWMVALFEWPFDSTDAFIGHTNAYINVSVSETL